MLRYAELRQNPIFMTVRDKTGATFTVRAERLRRGLVKMTCECPRQLADGWCPHCLAVFSDRQVFESDKHREAFERLVGDTYLESAAGKLTKALDAFATAYRNMKFDRPADLNPSQLDNFGSRAYQAGEASGQLARALEQFIDELRLRPPPVRAYRDDLASSAAEQIDAENADADNLSGFKTQNSALQEPSVRAALPHSPEQLTPPYSTATPFLGDKDGALEMVRKALAKELD